MASPHGGWEQGSLLAELASDRLLYARSTHDISLLHCSQHWHHLFGESIRGRGEGLQTTLVCPVASRAPQGLSSQNHTLDQSVWGGVGRADDSGELGLSGSQVPLPTVQPHTVLEIPKKLKCDRQNKVPSQKMHTSSFLESLPLYDKGHFADGIK